MPAVIWLLTAWQLVAASPAVMTEMIGLRLQALRMRFCAPCFVFAQPCLCLACSLHLSTASAYQKLAACPPQAHASHLQIAACNHEYKAMIFRSREVRHVLLLFL